MSEAVVATPVNRTTRSRAATRELWLDRLARFPASGLTVVILAEILAVGKQEIGAVIQRFPRGGRPLTVAEEVVRRNGARIAGRGTRPMPDPPRQPAVQAADATGSAASSAALRARLGRMRTWMRKREER